MQQQVPIAGLRQLGALGATDEVIEVRLIRRDCERLPEEQKGESQREREQELQTNEMRPGPLTSRSGAQDES
jgi:hypothetical protein